MLNLGACALAMVMVGYFVCPAWSQDDPDIASGFQVYGQINRAIRHYDDGQEEFTDVFIDNSKSVSRVGVTYDHSLDNGWQFQSRAEIGLTWEETNEVSQDNPDPSAYEFNRQVLRKLEISFTQPDIGTFFVGQGAMASDGVTGQDLSLTTVVAGAAVKDMAGGMYFRSTDGDLTRFRIQDRFRTLGSSRRLRLRFDTPVKNNISYSIAAGKEVLNDRDGRFYADAAVRYDATKGDYRIKAAAALRWAGGNSDTNFQDEQISLIGSGSVLHRPSRFNVTMAYGVEKDGGTYGYAKLGRRWYKLLPYGWTAASIDYYVTEDGKTAEWTGNSVGIAVVQQFKEKNFDVYGAIRRYEYDDEDADYFDSLAVLTGVRWRF
ncbi:MAG: porin [Pseudoruegeria sp.]